ncbi:hypothetical protein [Pseudarthrobacter sp. NPDC080039]|uniref:hypothetical protein n=1 Tax=Pseudarthrobacter sp. NPDC080039 TaxID=3155290 RepID=UPI00344EB4FB
MGLVSPPSRTPTSRGLVMAVAAVSLLAGCGAGPGTPAPGPAVSVAASPSASVPLYIPVAAAGGPSAEALMVCGEETRANIVRILALPSSPGTAASWADKLYTCTYALPGGALVLSVKEATGPDAAHAYFQDLQRSTAGAAPIEGLANLGFPAFQTPASAVFVKDNFVLTVDGAALPDTLGPHQVTRAAFAYQVATTVLACWSE